MIKCLENQGYIIEGALYHVMVRGNNGEKVFTTGKEKLRIYKHIK